MGCDINLVTFIFHVGILPLYCRLENQITIACKLELHAKGGALLCMPKGLRVLVCRVKCCPGPGGWWGNSSIPLASKQVETIPYHIPAWGEGYQSFGQWHIFLFFHSFPCFSWGAYSDTQWIKGPWVIWLRNKWRSKKNGRFFQNCLNCNNFVCQNKFWKIWNSRPFLFC